MFESSLSISEQFKQEELSDIIRDLKLSKEAAEILASRLKEKTALESELQQHSTVPEKKNYFRVLAKKKNLFTVKISKGFY